jgi:hypothetical protein
MILRQWFQHKNATKLEIYVHRIDEDKSDPAIVIEDSKAILHLMNRIEQIPANGNEMKSFGEETEVIDLCFYNGDDCQEIRNYRKRFKTPSTGFNAMGNEIEVKLYRDIDALLFPAINKIMLKVEGLQLQFNNFSITYTGSEFHDLAPATVSYTYYNFILKDKHQKEQSVQVISGQIPPQPLPIEVNGNSFILLTFHSKDEERLYPDYFQLVQK